MKNYNGTISKGPQENKNLASAEAVPKCGRGAAALFLFPIPVSKMGKSRKLQVTGQKSQNARFPT
jgi:hypothetical protein